MSSQPPRPLRVTTKTEIIVPESIDIYEIRDRSDSELHQNWIEILRPLVKAKGHTRSGWGRCLEREEHVLLITSWASVEHLEDFQASPDYSAYQSGISQFMSILAIVKRMEGVALLGQATSCNHLGIVTIYFSSSASGFQRQKISQLRSELGYKLAVSQPRYNDGGSNKPPSPPDARYVSPCMQLSTSHLNPEYCDRDGKMMRELLCFDFWRNCELEMQYKEEVLPYHFSEQGSLDGVHIVKYWEGTSERRWCFGMERGTL